MNIGDKVRLVHGREEGIVYAFLPGNLVEVEIEEGFRIPVLKNELVTISPVEQQRLKVPEPQPVRKRQSGESPVGGRPSAPFAEKGLYLAFVPVNDRAFVAHLINNSDWVLPFAAAQEADGRVSGLAAGVLSPRTSQRLTEVLAKDIEQWPVFLVQALRFRTDGGKEVPPFERKVRCRAKSFYNRRQKVPVLDRDGYVFQLDGEGASAPGTSVPGTSTAPKPISAAELREEMLSPAPAVERKPERAEEVVDLHYDKLSDDGERSNAEKLQLQLDTFEKQLEKTIAAGQREVTFIHGTGSGVLRQEIHRRLSRHNNVEYYKDARKEKFGYGATYVKIK